MGPFELADYVGLDTNKFIIDGELVRNAHALEYVARVACISTRVGQTLL